ncbi:MAG: sulfatase [Balneolaceae bacterium]|nr:sulfatase [Balneolaceae bacterium]
MLVSKLKALVLYCCALLVLLAPGQQTNIGSNDHSIKQESLPNIIIFVADDASWRDSGAYGNKVIQTPNIDALAEGGLLFENAFLTTPQCSPSRISVLTSLYPHATGAEDLHMPLPSGTKILPGYLSEVGYYTGHMLKTHYGPNADAQFDWYSENLSEDFPSFLDEASGDPFFLWVGFSDPHRPYERAPEIHLPEDVIVPPYLVDNEETRKDLARYYNEISRMDGQIGRFLDELKNRNLTENTLVIFFSDNGAPFPREKGTLYDSGIKTPLIFYWPANINEGLIYDGLTSIIDLTPTLLDITGIDVPEEMQGNSIRPVLSDTSLPGREAVFSERNWHDADEHIRSMRTKRYKVVRNEAYTELPHGTPADIGGSPSFRSLIELKNNDQLSHSQSRLFQVPRPRVELYDLQNDPWEVNNVASHPEYWQLARELSAQLDDWMEKTDDFPPYKRVRDDHTDRLTGVWFSDEIPEMRNVD